MSGKKRKSPKTSIKKSKKTSAGQKKISQETIAAFIPDERKQAENKPDDRNEQDIQPARKPRRPALSQKQGKAIETEKQKTLKKTAQPAQPAQPPKTAKTPKTVKKALLSERIKPARKKTPLLQKDGTVKTYLDYSAEKLPNHYEDNRLVLIARDPETMFAYWDLPQIFSGKQQDKLLLKIYKSSKPSASFEEALLHREIPITKSGNSCYIPVDPQFSHYQARIVKAPHTSHALAQSNHVHTPSRLSQDTTKINWQSAEQRSKHLQNIILPNMREKGPFPQHQTLQKNKAPTAPIDKHTGENFGETVLFAHPQPLRLNHHAQEFIPEKVLANALNRVQKAIETKKNDSAEKIKMKPVFMFAQKEPFDLKKTIKMPFSARKTEEKRTSVYEFLAQPRITESPKPHKEGAVYRNFSGI